MAPLTQLIRQLGFLRLGTAAARRGIDDDRLLHLFHNRAALKKAYVALQDELHRLKERIRQQEDATARVQEMLQGLEARLGQSSTAYPALVFYHLRELWGQSRTLLANFVAEVAARQEERERRAFLAERNRRLFTRRQAAEAALREAEGRAQAARAAVTGLEQQLAQLRRLWHYFRRRALAQQLQTAGLAALLAVQELEAARQSVAQLDAETQPEFAGLSIEARRAINLAAIAYGQLLYERLSATPLVELAAEAASLREPPREDYGDRAACEAMMAQIDAARTLLASRDGLQQAIRTRSERLRQLARYRAATDTLPTAESLNDSADGSKVLAEDLWESYRVLLR